MLRVVGGEAAEDRRADRMQPKFERRHDAEVAAAAAQRPEELRVLALARAHELARTRSRARPPIRLSQARPHERSSQPEPPPSVSPATPVVETRPPVVASPCSWVAASNAAQVSPAPARAVRASGSTAIVAEAAHVDHEPAVAQRHAGDRVPARADRELDRLRRARTRLPSGRPRRVAQRAIAAGRLSIIALKSVRASS